MTFLELFKTCTAEEIVEEFGKYIENLKTVGATSSSPWIHWLAFDTACFDGINECPENCPHLYEGDDYISARCYLNKDEVCPHGINLIDSSKKQFMEWLNSDISKGMEVE